MLTAVQNGTSGVLAICELSVGRHEVRSKQVILGGRRLFRLGSACECRLSLLSAYVPTRSTSRSATLVVLARAHLTWMGVVDDPYARRMLPSGWANVESILRIRGLGRLGRNRSFAYLGARTCFYDQFVASALDRGIHQVVVLGAGYDSRAWRFARPGVTFYEVDLPLTQADKRSRAPTGGPIYVPADVTDSSLADALTDAGFLSEEPTAFTAEGLTMYLTEQQVALLLRSLSALGGPGSRLAASVGASPGSSWPRVERNCDSD